MNSRERISILAPSFARLPGGGARTYFEHANALAERGYRVSVVHSSNLRPDLRGRIADLGRSKVRDLRAGLVRKRVTWMPLDPRVELTFVDAFDGRSSLPAADLRIGTFWSTTEFLAGLPDDGAARMQLIQAYETWAGPAERVDATWRLPMHAAVVSESLRRRGLDLGVPPERLHVVPNGLDHEVFFPSQPIPGRPAAVSFLVHQAPVKGLAASIETVQLVHDKRPDVAVLAFGGGPRPASLPDFVTYLRRPIGAELAERVYNASAVFLCTSLSEGFGFPSIEAMACGTALVSTRNGGVDDFAVDGESALLSDVGDTSHLARSVLRLLDDSALRERIAEQGRRDVARFTWPAAADAFEAVVRAALDAGTRVP